jgi:hypothetical protein
VGNETPQQDSDELNGDALAVLALAVQTGARPRANRRKGLADHRPA